MVQERGLAVGVTGWGLGVTVMAMATARAVARGVGKVGERERVPAQNRTLHISTAAQQQQAQAKQDVNRRQWAGKIAGTLCNKPLIDDIRLCKLWPATSKQMQQQQQQHH
jgi:hypothetical protein